MNDSPSRRARALRWAAILVSVGLVTTLATVFPNHAMAFILFGSLGATCLFAGVVVAAYGLLVGEGDA